MLNKKITSILFIFVLMFTVVCSSADEVSENLIIHITINKLTMKRIGKIIFNAKLVLSL